MDENERLSIENKRIKEELDQGTCAKLDEYNARVTELERNLGVVRQRRDALKAKYEYVSMTMMVMMITTRGWALDRVHNSRRPCSAVSLNDKQLSRRDVLHFLTL